MNLSRPAPGNIPERTTLLHPSVRRTRHLTLTPRPVVLPAHSREGEVRIIVILEGEVHIEENVGNLLLPQNTILLCRSDEPVLLKAGRRESAKAIEVILSGSLATEYTSQLSKIYGRVLRLPEERSSRTLTQKLVKLGSELPAADLFYWISGLHEAAKIQLHNLGQLLEGGTAVLYDLAERNAFSVQSIALELGCTVNHLCRWWQRYGHDPLVPQVRKMRLELAMQLLSRSNMSLDTIARHCGYSCGSSFCASFKGITGTTPGRWRKDRKDLVPNPRKILRKPLSPFLDDLHMEELTGHDERPICLWEGPFFQFDGGEVSFPYRAPYNLSLNSITSSYMWVCTLEGQAEFEIDGERILAEPGSVIFFPKPLTAKWHTPEQKPWRRVWVQMRDPWSQRIFSELADSKGWAFRIPLDSDPVPLARKWVERWNAGRGIPSVSRSRAAYQWLLSWEKLLHSPQAKAHPFPKRLRIQDKSCYQRIGTISSYAKAVGYSRSYLTRRLGEQWQGGTPSQIVRRHRLAQAAHELRNQRNKKVGTIASRALYSNTSAFIAAFKKEFGVTPLAYRHRNFE